MHHGKNDRARRLEDAAARSRPRSLSDTVRTMATKVPSPPDTDSLRRHHHRFTVKTIILGSSSQQTISDGLSSSRTSEDGEALPHEQQMEALSMHTALSPAHAPASAASKAIVGFKSFSFSPSLVITKRGILSVYPPIGSPSAPFVPSTPSPFLSFGGSWRRNKAAQPFPTLPPPQNDPRQEGSEELKETWVNLLGTIHESPSSSSESSTLTDSPPGSSIKEGFNQDSLTPLVVIKSESSRHDPKAFLESSLLSLSLTVREFKPSLKVEGPSPSPSPSPSINTDANDSHESKTRDRVKTVRRSSFQMSLQKTIKSCRKPSELVSLLREEEMDATSLSTLIDHYTTLYTSKTMDGRNYLPAEEHRAFLHEICLRLAPQARDGLSPRYNDPVIIND